MSGAAPPPLVYKIFRTGEWEGFLKSGTFKGSEHDKRDGFIHLCTEEQLAGTLSKHFTDCARVIVAEISTGGLPIKMEVSRAQMLFPHLYGTLRQEDVTSFEERELP